ncbi:MAG TPA: response regulator [Planctomycetota bacterium]|nr:response regulator [Planctomycetota bacterium]
MSEAEKKDRQAKDKDKKPDVPAGESAAAGKEAQPSPSEAKDATSSGGEKGASGDAAPSQPPAAPRGKLVVADDILLMRNLLAKSLRKAGYEVREAGNGKEVLGAVAEQRPDLIIMDSMMPVMSGPECLRQLKASADTKDIPVIMCTAKSEKKDVIETAKAGAVDYIVKPFRIETVLERVAKQLGGGQDSTPA